ncbi:hypothetical protein U9M48_004835 [Paspalum notatum var. saurae]|uniref:Retrotransposon gag domain-containing protein n=1 Tax=Paspalum notatum var. saurae TaxID=547442 RepID=A0AAQ3PL44_PASNO
MMEQQQLAAQVEANGKAISRIILERMAREMEDIPDAASQASDPPESPRHGGRGRPGEKHANRSTFGRSQGHDGPSGYGHSHLPKLTFPKFDGTSPKIWVDKCEDYFRIFSIKESMWVMAASLHMEGNAAKWFQVFKVQHRVTTWKQFVDAVTEKFGIYEYRDALNDLLDLKQTGTVEDYVAAFVDLQYQISLHNMGLDAVYFVSQFIKGLKPEL